MAKWRRVGQIGSGLFDARGVNHQAETRVWICGFWPLIVCARPLRAKGCTLGFGLTELLGVDREVPMNSAWHPPRSASASVSAMELLPAWRSNEVVRQATMGRGRFQSGDMEDLCEPSEGKHDNGVQLSRPVRFAIFGCPREGAVDFSQLLHFCVSRPVPSPERCGVMNSSAHLLSHSPGTVGLAFR